MFAKIFSAPFDTPKRKPRSLNGAAFAKCAYKTIWKCFALSPNDYLAVRFAPRPRCTLTSFGALNRNLTETSLHFGFPNSISAQSMKLNKPVTFIFRVIQSFGSSPELRKNVPQKITLFQK